MLDRVRSQVTFDFASRLDAKGCSIISNGVWSWPSSRSTTVLEVIDQCSVFPDVSVEDKLVWLPTNGSFSIQSAWNCFMGPIPKVDWVSLVWYKGHIPKVAFISWLAVRGGLVTQETLSQWRIIESTSCVFCKGQVEDINHLFFSCDFIAPI